MLSVRTTDFNNPFWGGGGGESVNIHAGGRDCKYHQKK